jgi:hypothetical protein
MKFLTQSIAMHSAKNTQIENWNHKTHSESIDIVNISFLSFLCVGTTMGCDQTEIK